MYGVRATVRVQYRHYLFCAFAFFDEGGIAYEYVFCATGTGTGTDSVLVQYWSSTGTVLVPVLYKAFSTDCIKIFFHPPALLRFGHQPNGFSRPAPLATNVVRVLFTALMIFDDR